MTALGKEIKRARGVEGLTQQECARRLGVSKSHLCDVESGRKRLGYLRAARWARQLSGKLKYNEASFVRYAIEDELAAAGLKYRVVLEQTSGR